MPPEPIPHLPDNCDEWEAEAAANRPLPVLNISEIQILDYDEAFATFKLLYGFEACEINVTFNGLISQWKRTPVINPAMRLGCSAVDGVGHSLLRDAVTGALAPLLLPIPERFRPRFP